MTGVQTCALPISKAYDFDEKGFETTLDYPKAIKMMDDAGLDLFWSIEWEGKRAGPIGSLATNELVKYSIAQVQGKEYEIDTSYWEMDENEFMDNLLDEE